MSDIRFNRWLHQSGTGGVYQNGSGRVGIGSSAPTEILDVVGNATFSGNVSIGCILTYDDVTNIDSVGVITARSGIHVTGGRVGIGTDNPQEDLHVYKASSSTAIKVETTSPTGAASLQLKGGSGRVDFGVPGGSGNRGRILYANNANTVTGAAGDRMEFFTNNDTSNSAILITSNNKVGIGTNIPAEKLSVDGVIESTSQGVDSATEGGQLVLRAPRNQTGTKYRYSIDNYWGESSHGRAGGAGNEVSGIRFIREDDSPAANGQVLMTLAEDGIMYLPYQPAFDAVYDPGNGGVYYTTANTEIVFNTTNNNRGGHFSTTTGRFTAPITGSYFFSIGAMNNGSTGGTTAWYELRVNGSLLTNPHNSYASVQNGSGFRHVTSQYVLQLNDGDYVSVFTASTTGGIYGGGNNHNHFVGHLIG